MWTSCVCPLQVSVSCRQRWSPLRARQHIGCWDEYCQGPWLVPGSVRFAPSPRFVSERLFRRAREQSRTLVLRTHRNLVACWIPPASLIENVECPLDKESRSVPETSQGSCNADGLSEVFAGKGAGAVAASSLPNYTVMTCHFPSLFFFL